MKTILNPMALILLAGLVLAGCQSGTEDANVTTGTEDAQATSTAKVEMTRGAMSSREGKPGAPVSLAYELPAKPALGTPIDIVLTFTIDNAVDEVEFGVTPSEGLEIVGSTRQLKLNAQEMGARHVMTVSVIPWETGLRFINVFADTHAAGQHSRRTFAVPVAGGGDATRQKGDVDLQVMPDGEQVISLPAEESD